MCNSLPYATCELSEETVVPYGRPFLFLDAGYALPTPSLVRNVQQKFFFEKNVKQPPQKQLFI